MCLGLKPSYPIANPITRELRFVSYRSQAATAQQVGELRNFGDIPFTLFSAVFTGDPAQFQLNVYFNGANLGSPEQLRNLGGITLNPGEHITIDGQFAPQSTKWQAEAVRFQTNVAGEAVVEVPVIGQVSDVVSLFPEQINFGIRTIGDTASRNFLVQALDIYSFRLFGFRVEDDPDGEFSVSQPGGTVQVNPGEAHLATVIYAPRNAGEVQPRIIAETDAGDFELEVFGFGAPPPVPQLEANRSMLQFGLVIDGMSDERGVRVESVGHTVIQLTSLAVTGDPAFELVGVPNTPIFLDHGESLDVSVRFNASGFGSNQAMRYGSLMLTTNGQPAQLGIALTGAVAPPQ
jgi:hypothetical protein